MDQKESLSEIKFELYHNELSHSNNIIVTEHEHLNAVYLTVDNLNYLQSKDPLFCDFILQWIGKLKRNAQGISIEAEGSRIKFFRKIDKKLKAFEKIIMED